MNISNIKLLVALCCIFSLTYAMEQPDERLRQHDKLINAIRNGNLEEVKEAIEKGAYLEKRSQADWEPSPLEIAIEYAQLFPGKNRLPVLKLLLKSGAQCSKPGRWGKTPLEHYVDHPIFSSEYRTRITSDQATKRFKPNPSAVTALLGSYITSEESSKSE